MRCLEGSEKRRKKIEKYLRWSAIIFFVYSDSDCEREFFSNRGGNITS
jgi:hypothetical protein